jgi:hypothetical protein
MTPGQSLFLGRRPQTVGHTPSSNSEFDRGLGVAALKVSGAPSRHHLQQYGVSRAFSNTCLRARRKQQHGVGTASVACRVRLGREFLALDLPGINSARADFDYEPLPADTTLRRDHPDERAQQQHRCERFARVVAISPATRHAPPDHPMGVPPPPLLWNHACCRWQSRGRRGRGVPLVRRLRMGSLLPGYCGAESRGWLLVHRYRSLICPNLSLVRRRMPVLADLRVDGRGGIPTQHRCSWPNRKEARSSARAFCAARGISYYETGVVPIVARDSRQLHRGQPRHGRAHSHGLAVTTAPHF